MAYSRSAIVMTAVIVGVVVAVKAALVWTYAPLALGDNEGFVVAADQMLAGPRWLSDAGLGSSAFPPTLWRPIGYSLVIAGAKAVFGGGWAYAVCTLQAVLSLLAGIALLRLCLSTGLGIAASLAVFALFEASVPLSTDALIMEDAFIGAFCTFAVCIVLKPIVAGRSPPVSAFLAAGLLVALSFTIRDVFHFVVPVLGALTVALYAIHGRWRAGLLPALALAAPVFLAASALQAWNYHRTGQAVTTTAGQTAYLYGVLRAAKHDPAVIGGPTQVEAVLRESNRTFDYTDTRAANVILFERHGMDAPAQAAAAQSLFWHALLRYPLAFIKASLERVRFVQQASLFASPLTRLDDLHWWAGGATEEGYRTGWRADALTFLQSRDMSKLTAAVFFNLGARAVCQVAGIVLFLMFLAGAPLTWLLLRGRLNGAADAALIAWALYGLLVCVYLPVSLEVRYLSPVIGGALFALAVVACNVRTLVAQAVERLRGSGRPES